MCQCQCVRAPVCVCLCACVCIDVDDCNNWCRRQGVCLRLELVWLWDDVPCQHWHSFRWLAAVPAVPSWLHQQRHFADMHGLHEYVLYTDARVMEGMPG